MKNKTLWKQVGAAAIAAAMVMSTVPATPVQAAGGKTLAVSSQKQLNQALKTVKGKNAVITVKAGKNVKITIPKGTYKVTIRVVGKKAAVVNNGTVKEIVVNSKGTVAIKNNGTIKKVTVQNAKSVSFSGNHKKAVPVVVNAEDVSMILAAPAKITAKKDVNIVLKKGAEKSSITCTKNVQAQVDNQTKKAISVKIADGTTLKVESGESCTITPKGKKEDTSGEDKTDEKDKTDGKDQKTDDTSDGNASSGSSSSGNSSGGTTVETPSKLTEADLLKQGYQLKWQDNFDGNFLNRADWNVELHEKGWVNSEWQEYVDSDKNIQVKDGKLLIKPVETVNADGTRSYTSGRINTQGKHDFKYGYFECRAKVPTGKGYLPAFWMMPTDENLYGQWPKCGEIDIMEVMGQETNKAYGTIHYGEPHDQSQGTCTVDAKNNFADQYHTYACDWEPGKITWYIDGVKFHEESDWFSAKSGQGEVAYPAPFDQPFYMILNLAVGGSWVGYPDDSTTYADQQFAVDYVKVYQKDSYDENVSKPETPKPVLRDPDEEGNYIINGDFTVAEDLEDGKDWEFLTALGGEATAEIKDGRILIKTGNAGTADYSVQLVQPNLPIQKGGTYQVSFDAWADEARTMSVALTAPDNSYVRYLPDTTVGLTSEKQTYTYEFTMTQNDDANGRMEFNLGNTASTANVYITNVTLKKTAQADVSTEDKKTVRSDGNYVYNGSFQEGANRLEYWEIASDNAEVAVTGLEDGRRLKVTAPEGTTPEHPVVISQSELAMIAGAEYAMSFEAQGDAGKSIQATVAGQSFDAAVSGEKASYLYKFAMPAVGEGNNNLVFTISQPGTYYLDEIRIVEDVLIKNGSFNAGFAGYEPYVDGTAKASYTVDSLTEENAASYTIENTGDADWKIQLKQNNVELEQGQWYRLTLDAKSNIERKLMFAIQRDGSRHNDDWTPYTQVTVDLTNDYQTFKSEFQMKEPTDPESVLSISMGAVGGTQITNQHQIVIDNINLEKIDAPAIEEKPAGENILKNPDFSARADGWENAVTAPGEAAVSFEENKAVYNIANVGTADWNVQLKQNGITLEQGSTYKVAFKAHSTLGRTIKLAFLTASYDWYGGADISLTENETKEVELEFAVDKDTDTNMTMVVSMGVIEGQETPTSTVTLSDFSLVKIS